MSHFSVLVIGDDPEKQLAPYHEFECTGVADEYVQDVDITVEVLKQAGRDPSVPVEDQLGQTWEGLRKALSDHGIDEKQIVSDQAQLDLSGAHKYRYAIIINDELIKAVRRTNENKKWDWYVLGGRWSGHLKLNLKKLKGL